MVRKLLTRATLVAVMGASTSVHAGLLDSVDKTLSEPAKTVNKALGGNAGEVLNVADALPNRYIVVLKEGVAVNRTLDALMSRYGGQADLSFNSVLNGFAAYLNPLQVKALSLDNAVKYV
ncbi:protease inhibitor I9 family protein [Litorivivens sp.]